MAKDSKKGTKKIKLPGRRWYMFSLSGVVFCILGFLVMANPDQVYGALPYVFVAGLMVFAVMQLIDSLKASSGINWGWNLAFAIVYMVVAGVLFFNADITKELFNIIVGVIMLFQGAMMLGTSGMIRSAGDNLPWRWMAFIGILVMVLSFIVMTNQSFAEGYMIFILVLLFMSAGAGSLYIGYELHKLHKTLDKAIYK